MNHKNSKSVTVKSVTYESKKACYQAWDVTEASVLGKLKHNKNFTFEQAVIAASESTYAKGTTKVRRGINHFDLKWLRKSWSSNE